MGKILTIEQETLKRRSRVIQDGAQTQFDTGIMLLYHKNSQVISCEAWGEEWIIQMAECCRKNPVLLFSLQTACGIAANALLAESQNAPKQENSQDEPGEGLGDKKDL